MMRPIRQRERVADGIYDRLVDAIATGHLKRGAKLPTMRKIAEENGVTFRVARGVVKVVVQTNKGQGPVFPQSLTRFECDGAAVGEKVAAFVLGVLAKGRLPPVPRISPAYVFGKTFPWV